MLPLANTIEQQFNLFEKILKLLNDLNGLTLYNEIFMNVQTVLSNVIEKCSTESKERTANYLKPLIEQMAECESKTLLIQKLNYLLGV